MIKKETINGKILLTQTTYYVYDNESDYIKDKYELAASDKINCLKYIFRNEKNK